MVLAIASTGCGQRLGQPPSPGQARGRVPDLAGSTVLVFPVQLRSGVPGDPDAEIAFALEAAGGRTTWVGPDALRDHMARAPGVQLRVEGLPVDMFLAGEVLRIGDPLFGFIRRMAVLDDASWALLPVAARFRPATPEAPSAVEFVAALIETQTGRVVWHGVTEGFGARDDPAALAAAAERLAAWFR
jgi:hypothetical protein